MRSSSSALPMSPPASSSAFLHSIMPSPVRSRSSLTSPAVISAIYILSSPRCRTGPNHRAPPFAGATLTKKGLHAPFPPGPRGPLRLLAVLDLDEVFGPRPPHLADHLAAPSEARVRYAPAVPPPG